MMFMDVPENVKIPTREENQRIALLRDSIRRSFPDEAYTGKVTDYDNIYNPDDEATYILDENQDLYEALNGRRWTDIKPELMHHLPSGYDLLADEAYVAIR